MLNFGRFKTIRARLTIAFIILAIGPILLSTILLLDKSISALKKAAVAHQRIEAESVSIALEDYVHELERILELISLTHGFKSLGRIEQQDIFEDILSLEKRFAELTLAAQNGKELIRSNRTHVVFDEALTDRRNDPAFTHVVATKTNYFSPVAFDGKTGEPFMTIAIPLQSYRTGQVENVLIGSIRLKEIWDILATISHNDQLIFIIDKAGNIIGHPDPSVSLSGKKYALPSITGGVGVGLSGNKVVIATKQVSIGQQSLYIIAQQEAGTALALSQSIVYIGLVVVTVSLVVAVFLSFFVIGNIVRPLQHLATVARNIQKGDFRQKVSYRNDDEVGELSKAFNDMTRRLRDTIESLERENKERRHAEEILRESRSMLNQVLNTAPQSIFWKDINGTYLGCNRVFAQLAGLESPEMIQGKTDFDLPWPKEEAEAYRADDREVTQYNRPKLHIIETLQQADGKTIWIDTSKVPLLDGDGNVYGVLGVFQDITKRRQAEEDRKELESRLLQSQKMEAIGTLAGGIAHDFNNILTAIMGYTELAAGTVEENSEIAGMLRETLKASERAKNLVKQILACARKEDENKIPLQIHFVVKEALQLLRASIPTTIEIREDICASNGVILADPTKIHQIVMNLGTNAYHAMSETGGVMTVALKPVSINNDDHDAKDTELAPGEYFQLTISDTGHGIEQSTMERIFDPYFTTKKQGKGTGMGLAVVHGIVKSHGGEIAVQSELEHGSTFTVMLPAASMEASELPAKDACDAMPGGNERVLLVDDEEAIVHMNQQMLEGLGYQVTSTTSSAEALEIFYRHPEDFDLVVTDMTMPQVTGAELAEKILAKRKEIPIILCTGFSELLNAKKAKEIGIRKLISKPVALKNLVQDIRTLLDEAKSQG